MNTTNILSSLINDTTLDQKELRRKIMATLQLTNDFMTVKALTDKIICGDFGGLKEKDTENLINTLKDYYSGDAAVSELVETEQTKDDSDTDDNDDYRVMIEENKKILTEMRKMQEAMKDMAAKMKSLEVENKKYREMFKITDTHKLIEASDDEVNELYMLYKTEQKTEHRFAFIIDNKLVKSYYNLTDNTEVI